jgi:hypothetical protein
MSRTVPSEAEAGAPPESDSQTPAESHRGGAAQTRPGRRRRRRPQGTPAGQGKAATSALVEKPEEPSETVVLEWSVHMGRGRPWKLAAGVAAILAACAAAFFLLQNPITPIVIAFVLLAALGDLFFPMHFRITTEGAYRRNFVSSAGIRWKDVRKCYLGPDGIKISPLGRRSRLEPFRGIYLHFGKIDRDFLIDKIKELRDGAQSTEHRARSPEREARSAGHGARPGT